MRKRLIPHHPDPAIEKLMVQHGSVKFRMTEYVLGFVFDPRTHRVLLIKKARPEWQAGLLNGLGGKVEASDKSLRAAMAREFKEECGLGVDSLAWRRFGRITSKRAIVYLFAGQTVLQDAKDLTDEPVTACDPFDLPEEVVPSLRWLCPLAHAVIFEGEKVNIKIRSEV